MRPDLLGIVRGLSGLGFRAISMTTNGLRLCRLRDDEGNLRPLLRGGASYEALKQRMSEFIYRKPWGAWIAGECHSVAVCDVPDRRVNSGAFSHEFDKGVQRVRSFDPNALQVKRP